MCVFLNARVGLKDFPIPPSQVVIHCAFLASSLSLHARICLILLSRARAACVWIVYRCLTYCDC